MTQPRLATAGEAMPECSETDQVIDAHGGDVRAAIAGKRSGEWQRVLSSDPLRLPQFFIDNPRIGARSPHSCARIAKVLACCWASIDIERLVPENGQPNFRVGREPETE